jgi:hypothetical protein
MEPEPRSLQALGKALQQAHTAAVEGTPPETHAAARQRLIGAATSPRARRSSRVAPWVGVAAAAAAALVCVVWALRSPEAERTARPSAAAGQWLAAPADRPLPIALEDGTRLTLAARSRVRVETPAGAGTEIVLESGVLHAQMTPRPGARWRVAAGPFEVLVTGTEFNVSWEPEGERFELRLVAGTVEVSGPLLPEGRRVQAGQTVRVSGRSRLEVIDERPATERIAMGPTPPPEPAPAVPTSSIPAEPMGPSVPVVGPDASVVSGPAPLDRPASPADAAALAGWEELAAQRRHADALALARAEGLDRLCTILPQANLVRLADTARYARDVDAATMLLQCVRDRFPGTGAAAEAAFKYGRVVSDVRGNALAAAAWFETYLREAPDGSLAREALGRLVEAYDRLGNASAARGAAERYLERYPDGPHAELARRVAGR